jgi:hypothetical protein
MKINTKLMMIVLFFSINLCAQINIKKLKKDTYQINEQIIDLSIIDKINSSKKEKMQFKNLAIKIIDNLKKSANLIKHYKKQKIKISANNPKYLKKFREETRAKLERYDKSNQILMVSMQGSMQQRSQSVTMATQMLKSINDSSDSIALNIGI